MTGGGAGMGACDCWKFAEEGAKGILIVDLNVDDAEKVAKEIMAQYPECKCVAVKCNVAKEADVDHCFEVLDQEFGTLDILVNNAGITNKIPFDEMTLEHWNLTYSINTVSYTHLDVYKRQGQEGTGEQTGRCFQNPGIGALGENDLAGVGFQLLNQKFKHNSFPPKRSKLEGYTLFPLYTSASPGQSKNQSIHTKISDLFLCGSVQSAI